jgi:hypothetical protein
MKAGLERSEFLMQNGEFEEACSASYVSRINAKGFRSGSLYVRNDVYPPFADGLPALESERSQGELCWLVSGRPIDPVDHFDFN